jgi:lipopolysaccharide transport system permease protein
MTVLNQAEKAIDKPVLSFRKRQQKKAIEDFIQSIKQSHIWFLMAWQDIQLRYRRSIIGPFWITLSMAIMVYSMGFLYSHLWKVSAREYFPFLATGLLSWGLISSIIIESTETYLFSVGLIKQIKMPYLLHINRMCTRNFIIFAHNILIMLPVYIIFSKQFPLSFAYLLFFIDVLCLYFIAVLYANIIAMVCARYRDLGQIIKSFIQVLFFLTPIMWKIETLPEHIRVWMNLNPLYHFVQLIREPLMGCYPSLNSYMMVLACAILGLLFNQLLFVPYRARIVYWI